MLKEKYQDLLTLGEKLHVKDGSWKEEGGKLHVTGTTEYQLEKDLLWDKIKSYPEGETEVKANIKVRCRRKLKDGSRLIAAPVKDPATSRLAGHVLVREITARVTVAGGKEPLRIRLWTTLLDPATHPAEDLVKLYAERWEEELFFRELKSHVQGTRGLLHSQRPESAAQEVLALAQVDAARAHGLEDRPAPRIGNGNAARYVLAVNLDVEGRGWPPTHVARADLDALGSGPADVDGVAEPLAGFEVDHHLAAAGGIRGDDDVHVLGRPVLPPGVARDVVVVRDALAAAIEILRLDGARDSDRRSGKGRGRRGGSRRRGSQREDMGVPGVRVGGCGRGLGSSGAGRRLQHAASHYRLASRVGRPARLVERLGHARWRRPGARG